MNERKEWKNYERSKARELSIVCVFVPFFPSIIARSIL
jgi:hypothetical protein